MALHGWSKCGTRLTISHTKATFNNDGVAEITVPSAPRHRYKLSRSAVDVCTLVAVMLSVSRQVTQGGGMHSVKAGTTPFFNKESIYPQIF